MIQNIYDDINYGNYNNESSMRQNSNNIPNQSHVHTHTHTLTNTKRHTVFPAHYVLGIYKKIF